MAPAAKILGLSRRQKHSDKTSISSVPSRHQRGHSSISAADLVLPIDVVLVILALSVRALSLRVIPSGLVHARLHIFLVHYMPADWSRSSAAAAPLVFAASVLRGASLMILAGLPATTL